MTREALGIRRTTLYMVVANNNKARSSQSRHERNAQN